MRSESETQALDRASTERPCHSEGNLSRRAFLRVSATTGGGLLLAFSTPQAIRFAGAQGMSAPGDFAPNGFIRIDRDGRITLIVCQVEMGVRRETGKE